MIRCIFIKIGRESDVPRHKASGTLFYTGPVDLTECCYPVFDPKQIVSSYQVLIPAVCAVSRKMFNDNTQARFMRSPDVCGSHFCNRFRIIAE